MRRIPSPGLVALTLLAALAAGRPAAAQQPARVVTQGEALPDHRRAVPVASDSKGSTCAHSATGGKQNDIVLRPDDPKNCSIIYQQIVKDQLQPKTLAGKGRITSKFTVENQKLVRQSDAASSATFANFGQDNETQARGYSAWTSDPKDQDNPVTDLYASGEVKRKDRKTSPPGTGAAQTTDPMVFDFLTDGSLDYAFWLGGVPGLVEPDPALGSPRVALGSDDPLGVNVLTVSAGLTGVRLGGEPLNGELFRLIIQGGGVITSPSQLEIRFVPWAGLGMDDADVAGYVGYVRSRLHLLSDGAVGLNPGEQLALIGPGSPIPLLTFEYEAGRVTSSSSVGAVAAVVPEPGSGALAALGVATLALARRRHRTREST